MQNEGYDGVINEEDGTIWEYVAFSPNQIKSADPVTYDDAGNVIPLSERFNPEKEDIRYSLSTSNQSAIRYDKVNGTNVKDFFDFLRNGKEFKEGKPNLFHIANAGDLLQRYGIKGKFMVGTFTFSRTHTDNEDHKLGLKEWVDVINKINNPLAITSYKGQPNKFRIYTYATINGKNICVGVNVSLKDNVIELSRIISAYGRDINNLLGKESINLLYPSSIEELKQRISQGSTAHNSLLNATSSASDNKDTTSLANDQISNEENSTQTLTTANGEVIADVNETQGQALFSLRTYREGGVVMFLQSSSAHVYRMEQ